MSAGCQPAYTEQETMCAKGRVPKGSIAIACCWINLVSPPIQWLCQRICFPKNFHLSTGSLSSNILNIPLDLVLVIHSTNRESALYPVRDLAHGQTKNRAEDMTGQYW